ncbi:MAG: amidohydrolase family protein [Propionibacteriaceae bacterium]
MTTPGPLHDEDLPAYRGALGLPGLADVHVHFMPWSVLRKVWGYFDRAEEAYGRPWPITYRGDEATRLDTLRRLGVRRIPALTYAHRPDMAAWLNAWNAEFAERVPDAIHCGTFYPEPSAVDYVRTALAAGARLFKVHLQVGRFPPDDPQLEPVWELLAEAGVPTVLHAGSAPLAGEFTGPKGVERVLRRHPDLPLVVAHAGMPQYHAFADLVEQYEHVHLDTTMVGTDFTEEFAPLPRDYVARWPHLVDKIILGSDFPNIPYPYAHQVDALARLDLGDEWMRSVLWHNGRRLLDLAPEVSGRAGSGAPPPRPPG